MVVKNNVQIILTAKDLASKEIKGIGKNIKKIGDEMKNSLKIGAAIGGAALIGLTKQAIEMDSQFKKLQNQIGATEEEMSDIKDISKDLFKRGLGENIQEVNQSLSFFVREMKLSGKALEDASEGALVLSKTFDKDVNEVVRTTSSLMKNFGIDAKKANDLSFKALQQVGDGYDDLLDSAQEYSAQFKKAGFEAEDMFNILIQGSQDGVFNIDKVGDAVKEFGVRLVDGSKATNESLTALGIDYNNLSEQMSNGTMTTADAMKLVNDRLIGIDDVVSRNVIGVGLYGTMWEEAGDQAIFNLTNITDHLGDVEGATVSASEVIDKSFNSAWREVQVTLIELVDPLKDVITNISASEEGMTKFKEATDILKTALGILITVVEFLVTSFWNGLTVIGEVIGFILYKLSVGIIQAKDFITGLINFLTTAWDIIKEGVSIGWDKIKNLLSELTEKIVTVVKDKFQVLIDFVNTAFETIVGVYNKAKDFANKAKNLAGGAVESIKGVFGSGDDNTSGARAVGGTVLAGKTYEVGERGPELFTPSTTGTITPNGVGGRGNNISINLGGVVIQKEADENRLVEKIKDELTRTLQLQKMGIS